MVWPNPEGVREEGGRRREGREWRREKGGGRRKGGGRKGGREKRRVEEGEERRGGRRKEGGILTGQQLIYPILPPVLLREPGLEGQSGILGDLGGRGKRRRKEEEGWWRRKEEGGTLTDQQLIYAILPPVLLWEPGLEGQSGFLGDLGLDPPESVRDSVYVDVNSDPHGTNFFC
jgi:hypothetical protein